MGFDEKQDSGSIEVEALHQDVILDQSIVVTDDESFDVIDIEDDDDDELLGIDDDAGDRPPLPDGWTQVTGDDGLVYTFDENGAPKCGSWIPKRQKYCEKAPKKNRNRCKLHGGNSPRGIASPSYKHGMYSKDMPSQLANRYREARQDDELMSLRDDIALISARVGEQLSGLHDGGMMDLILQARAVYSDLIDALRKDDDPSAQMYLSSLGTLLNKGASDIMTWESIEESLEKKRKLTDSERKRLVDMRQMVTVEELLMVVGGLVNSIKKHVTDQRKLQLISEDIRELLEDRGLS